MADPIELKGEIGEVHMTIQVTRKATGLVEEYKLIGKVLPDDPEQSTDEKEDPCL